MTKSDDSNRKPGGASTPPNGDRPDPRFSDSYVLLDAVVQFLFDDGKSVAAAKVRDHFSSSGDQS